MRRGPQLINDQIWANDVVSSVVLFLLSHLLPFSLPAIFLIASNMLVGHRTAVVPELAGGAGYQNRILGWKEHQTPAFYG